MSEDGIRARGLVKRFGTVVALAGVDLDVARGEIVSVLGPNGAGKSTLLRILGSTVIADEGSATMAGVSIAEDSAEARRRVGLSIGDERSLYWRLSGRQNLDFFAALHSVGAGRSKDRVNALLEAVGLVDAADRPVRNYSSGMRARLALARAMLGEPPLLLLDEPTGSLDPLAAARFRETMVALTRDRGTAILLATHDLHEAVEVSDRVVVLSAGSIVLEETTAGMDAARLEQAFLAAVSAQPAEYPSGEAP